MPEESERYAASIVAVEDISPDTRILRVEINSRQRLQFKAGQYVFLQGGGMEPRAFSIASRPDESFLEFHVRNSGYGFSAYAFSDIRPGMEVSLSAPMGQNVWRGAERPLLALAGGVGIAQIKAIVETHLAAANAAPATLYWGARNAGHFYLDDCFRKLAQRHGNFSYVPLVSEGDDTSSFRQSLIGPALAADFESLSGFSVYMAGPKAMIDATLPVLEGKGAEKDFIFCDAFA